MTTTTTTTTTIQDLKKFLENMAVDEFTQEKWRNIITAQYSLEIRYYHTLDHITDLLNLAKEYSQVINDMMLIQSAIWFHDIVYCPEKSDNEEKSVEVFLLFAEDIGLDKEFTQKVKTFIMATKGHDAMVDGLSEQDKNDLYLFLDFDLHILAAPRLKYIAYANNIEKEYAHMGSEYFKNRNLFLQFMIGKERIFHSVQFRKFEDVARENMSWESGILK